MIRTGRLIELCRRASTALQAGLAARKVWEIETTRGSGRDRQVFSEIHRRVSKGDSVADAFRDSGYFPSLVVEMVRVGEHTGHLDQIFGHLGSHYEFLQRQTRNFLLGIAWPMLQLLIAIGVIGLVIWLPSALSGQTIDVLRIGLSGTSGLVIYLTFIAVLFASCAAVLFAIYRGWLGTTPIRIGLRIPLIGRCLECLSLARCSWALALAHEAGMMADNTAKLALRASQNPFYRDQTPQVLEILAQNRSFHEAFAKAGIFPSEFLDALHTGELTGTITETLTRRSQSYDEESQRLLVQITWLAGAAVFCLVGAFIVLMIFRMAFWYINMLNGLANDPLNAPLN